MLELVVKGRNKLTPQIAHFMNGLLRLLMGK